VKLLSVQPLVAFKFISLKIADNRMNLVELTYNKVFTLADMVSYTCACAKASTPTSYIMSPYCLLSLALPVALPWWNRQHVQFGKQLESLLIRHAMSILYNF